MIDNFFLAERMTAMALRLSYPLRIVIVLLLLASTDLLGQNCDCPKASSCNVCAGGFTKMTLRYKGLLPGYVSAFDGGGQIYLNYLSPSDTFNITGSVQNEKFQGSLIYVHYAGILNAQFGTNCGSEYTGSASGMFEIVRITSKTGGVVCCAPGTNDQLKPVISNCPTNKSVNLPSNSCTTTATWTAPTATDNCKVTWTSTHTPNVSLFSVGTTPVTYTATDTYGNQSTCTFSVTVVDITPPAITCPANVTLQADAQCQATYPLPTPTITDNCTFTWSSSKADSSFPLGTTTVTYTATDISGNKTSCSFTVTVQDKTKPQFVNLPPDQNATVEGTCTVKVPWNDPAIKDNCTSAPTLTASHSKTFDFPLGTTRVKYTLVDAAGNSDTCSFRVIVTNAEIPAIEGIPNTVIENAEPKTDSATVTWAEPVGTATCGSVSVSKSHEPGSRFAVGITPVKYTFTDQTGKANFCEFDVHVLEADELFAISKVVTPDGDGINDIWTLANIETFKSNTVVVIDRWGNKIFHANGYDNERTVWKGTNSNGTIVPTGTYFYTIEIRDQGKVILKKGFIEVIQ